MTTRMTLLDRGLGFRIDAQAAVTETDARAIAGVCSGSTSQRFRYGICNLTSIGELSVESKALSMIMRTCLDVAESSPKLLLAVAGSTELLTPFDKYQPILNELPWLTHCCDTLAKATDWVSDNMRLHYGMIPDFVRTIPISEFSRDQ